MKRSVQLRRVLLGIAAVGAVLALLQWPRTAPRTKAAPAQSVDNSELSSRGEPVKAQPSSSAAVATNRESARAEQPRGERPLSAGQPPIPRDAALKASSSFIPPHQRANPDIWGRIIGTRLRWFNEELAEQKPSIEWTKAMQKRLTELGLYKDKIDGKAGMLTRAALGHYQKRNGLKVDCWPTSAVLSHMRR